MREKSITVSRNIYTEQEVKEVHLLGKAIVLEKKQLSVLNEKSHEWCQTHDWPLNISFKTKSGMYTHMHVSMVTLKPILNLSICLNNALEDFFEGLLPT